jgi:energy-converting hydrogenase Eha subunit H
MLGDLGTLKFFKYSCFWTLMLIFNVGLVCSSVCVIVYLRVALLASYCYITCHIEKFWHWTVNEYQ